MNLKLNNLSNIIFISFILLVLIILVILNCYTNIDKKYINNICNQFKSTKEENDYRDLIYNYPTWRISLSISFFTLIIQIVLYLFLFYNITLNINTINNLILSMILMFFIVYQIVDFNIKQFKTMINC